LEKPTNYTIKPLTKIKKTKKQKQVAITDGMAVLNDVDMNTDSENDEK